MRARKILKNFACGGQNTEKFRLRRVKYSKSLPAAGKILRNFACGGKNTHKFRLRQAKYSQILPAAGKILKHFACGGQNTQKFRLRGKEFFQWLRSCSPLSFSYALHYHRCKKGLKMPSQRAEPKLLFRFFAHEKSIFGLIGLIAGSGANI